jgi:hypothetical protein
MRFYNFAIVIEEEPEDEGYSAYSPSLPGCFSNGRTIEEAQAQQARGDLAARRLTARARPPCAAGSPELRRQTGPQQTRGIQLP